MLSLDIRTLADSYSRIGAIYSKYIDELDYFLNVYSHHGNFIVFLENFVIHLSVDGICIVKNVGSFFYSEDDILIKDNIISPTNELSKMFKIKHYQIIDPNLEYINNLLLLPMNASIMI